MASVSSRPAVESSLQPAALATPEPAGHQFQTQQRTPAAATAASPEIVTFAVDGDTGKDHATFVATPHPSKGVMLMNREPLRNITPTPAVASDLGTADAGDEGAAAGKILDNVVPAGSNPGLDSPVTPAVTPTEEFTVYEAKPSDYGNPLFGADLTPLPGMAPKPPVSTAAPTAGVEEGGTADIQDDDGSDENASPAQ
eukprot:CAMPEP_0117665346 /NCGR_PEP_ID=MMETSP0804-20121206/9760_1 /TAXON_ID=1074897 /ORGANISM="Tetraselmis astigmatica, Strain CCMP880" /LENGTH=197 /DNA_ID=CAMNT_0005472751 /DNA_START=160 /DNA_END=753 /DNA_ORIENTATION=-